MVDDEIKELSQLVVVGYESQGLVFVFLVRVLTRLSPALVLVLLFLDGWLLGGDFLGPVLLLRTGRVEILQLTVDVILDLLFSDVALPCIHKEDLQPANQVGVVPETLLLDSVHIIFDR